MERSRCWAETRGLTYGLLHFAPAVRLACDSEILTFYKKQREQVVQFYQVEDATMVKIAHESRQR